MQYRRAHDSIVIFRIAVTHEGSVVRVRPRAAALQPPEESYQQCFTAKSPTLFIAASIMSGSPMLKAGRCHSTIVSLIAPDEAWTCTQDGLPALSRKTKPAARAATRSSPSASRFVRSEVITETTPDPLRRVAHWLDDHRLEFASSERASKLCNG